MQEEKIVTQMITDRKIQNLGNYARIHWDYFLLLEKDLSDILDYIEPHESNLHAYGPKLAKLLLTTGSEIDVTFKDLIDIKNQKNSLSKNEENNMRDYREYAHNYLQRDLDQVEVSFARSKLVSTPWNDWWESEEDGRVPVNTSLSWWKAYNNVKHHRVECYHQATLENTLEALAGLFVLIGALARAENILDGYRPPMILEFRDRRYGRTWISRVEGSTLIMGDAPNFRFEPVETLL